MDEDPAVNPYASWGQINTYESAATSDSSERRRSRGRQRVIKVEDDISQTDWESSVLDELSIAGPSSYEDEYRAPSSARSVSEALPAFGGLTVSQVQQLGRSRLRPAIECQWKDCSASLLTLKLLDKHVKLHARQLARPGCRWSGCQQTFRSSRDLIDHVQSHIAGSAYCPFKACQHPLYRSEAHFLKGPPDHPHQPWTKEMLHPRPLPSPPRLGPLPPLPALGTATPLYLISCPPVKRSRKWPQQPLVLPPAPHEMIPFIPSRKRSRHETPLWNSSDIFRPDNDDEEEDDGPDLHPPPTVEEGTRVPLSIRPRSKLRAPLVPQVLDWLAYKQRTAPAAPEPTVAKPHPLPTPIATEKAATRWAQLQAGRSIGISYWAHYLAYSSRTSSAST